MLDICLINWSSQLSYSKSTPNQNPNAAFATDQNLSKNKRWRKNYQ